MRVPGMVDKDALVRAKAVQGLSEGWPTVLQQDALLLQPIIMNLKARYALEKSQSHATSYYVCVRMQCQLRWMYFHEASGC